ncbi:MAG: YraN family protein [Pseudomonadota bacterium]
MTHSRRQRAERKGRRGEWMASIALRLKGYRIVAKRYKTPSGEVDLIARRGDLVLLVEVKVRGDLMACHDAVSANAARRIEAAGDQWLSRQPDASRLSLRRDLIAITPRRWPIHIANAF